MSLVQRVESVANSLPSEVASVLKDIATEVESHKALLSEAGALGGAEGEAVATGVEAAVNVVETENKEAASSAPDTTYTSGEGSLKDPTPTDPTTTPTDDADASHVKSEEAPEEVGNPEQSLPYEAWPKA